MQRHRVAPADFLDQGFAARSYLLKSGGPKGMSAVPERSGERDLEIAHRPIVGRGQRVDLLRDPQ